MKNLIGIDFNPALVRVSKMRMILEEDGHTGIFQANSLESFELIKKSAKTASSLSVDKDSVQIILTNPPFGKKGKITDKVILKQFDLGHQWKKNNSTFEKTEKVSDNQVPDILFIERCLEFLENKGKMAIVLPDAILTGPKLQYVRDWLLSKVKLVAVISLPYSTFIPHGANVKASIIFVQKLDSKTLKKELENNYSVFLADIENIGYEGNKNGTVSYKKTDFGEFLYDKNHKKIVNEDISQTLLEWENYMKNNNTWVK